MNIPRSIYQLIFICNTYFQIVISIILSADTSLADQEGIEPHGDEGSDDEGDDTEFHAGEMSRASIQPRWPTRVFAADSVSKIIASCKLQKGAHFDLALAKEMQMTKNKGVYYTRYIIVVFLFLNSHLLL